MPHLDVETFRAMTMIVARKYPEMDPNWPRRRVSTLTVKGRNDLGQAGRRGGAAWGVMLQLGGGIFQALVMRQPGT